MMQSLPALAPQISSDRKRNDAHAGASDRTLFAAEPPIPTTSSSPTGPDARLDLRPLLIGQ